MAGSKTSQKSPETASPGKEKLESLIEEVVDLHTLPVIVLEADRLMRDPRTSAQQVADLLSRDPALAGRILRLVNSPIYGFQKRIGNLTQAIVILGFQTVKNLMLTVSVIESFRTGGSQGFDYPRFWAHSVGCAIAAGEIARLANAPHAEEAYIAGLLHDVGKLVVGQHLPELWETIAGHMAAGMPETEAEVEVLGRDHSDIGGMLARAWSLPPSLVDAIRDHHHPGESGAEVSAADVVHLADILVTALGIAPPEAVLPQASPGLAERLGYDEETLSLWVERISLLLEQANEFFEVVGAGALQLVTSVGNHG